MLATHVSNGFWCMLGHMLCNVANTQPIANTNTWVAGICHRSIPLCYSNVCAPWHIGVWKITRRAIFGACVHDSSAGDNIQNKSLQPDHHLDVPIPKVWTKQFCKGNNIGSNNLHASLDFGDGGLMPKVAKMSEFGGPAKLDGRRWKREWVVIGLRLAQKKSEKQRIFGNNGQTKFSPLPPIFFPR